MPTPDLITEPDAIDPTWTAAVLAGAGYGSDVARVSTEPVGDGLMGRSYRVHIEAQGPAPASVVVKLPSADAPTRELGAGAYRKEIGFYRDLAARVTASVPGCLHADISNSGEAFVLVLEDIHDATQGDQIRGCAVHEATAAIRNLALLHASTWDDQRIGNYAWCTPTEPDTIAMILPMALSAFRDRFGAIIDEGTGPVFERFVAGFDRWRELEPATRAAVHGDYRLDNLLFGGPARPVTVVDWQTVDYASPGRDVGYFLGNSLATAERRQHEQALLEVYVDTLCANGVTDYDIDRCVAETRLGMFQGPLVTMVGAFVASRSSRSETMFAVMADRAAAQILDHDALDFLV